MFDILENKFSTDEQKRDRHRETRSQSRFCSLRGWADDAVTASKSLCESRE